MFGASGRLGVLVRNLFQPQTYVAACITEHPRAATALSWPLGRVMAAVTFCRRSRIREWFLRPLFGLPALTEARRPTPCLSTDDYQRTEAGCQRGITPIFRELTFALVRIVSLWAKSGFELFATDQKTTISANIEYLASRKIRELLAG